MKVIELIDILSELPDEAEVSYFLGRHIKCLPEHFKYLEYAAVHDNQSQPLGVIGPTLSIQVPSR